MTIHDPTIAWHDYTLLYITVHGYTRLYNTIHDPTIAWHDYTLLIGPELLKVLHVNCRAGWKDGWTDGTHYYRPHNAYRASGYNEREHLWLNVN